MNSPPPPPVTFWTAVRFWFKLGFVSFGGPAAQISMLHRELVETRRWIDERSFLGGLNFCMLLPGPEAQQLATYIGWRLHGTIGGIVAGALFVVPSMFLLFALSWVYAVGGELPWIAPVFRGLLAAVLALIFAALLRLARKSLRTPGLAGIAAAAFVAILFLGVPYPWIVVSAAVVGALGHRWRPELFPTAGNDAGEADEPAQSHGAARPTWKRQISVLAVCLVLWWTPVLAAGWTLGWSSAPAQQGLFFSKAALVTFGGAYAVLPYVAQEAVETHEWLSHTQMMAGLALAETTPGPLIMVLQFVGFLGGWQQPGDLPPLASAAAASFVTTWVTFLPCFLFIFLGAPWIERIQRMPRLGAALGAITSAVTGVILSLGVKFAQHALWPEPAAPGEFDVFVAGLAALAFLVLQKGWLGLAPTIAACALAGWIWNLAL